MVEILGRNIEEDFLILIKNNPHNKQEEYIMRASLNGFPAGFDPRVNFNQPISFIHQPVPQYKSRLQFSMTKFFNNLQPDKLWVRHNWVFKLIICILIWILIMDDLVIRFINYQ